MRKSPLAPASALTESRFSSRDASSAISLQLFLTPQWARSLSQYLYWWLLYELAPGLQRIEACPGLCIEDIALDPRSIAQSNLCVCSRWRNSTCFASKECSLNYFRKNNEFITMLCISWYNASNTYQNKKGYPNLKLEHRRHISDIFGPQCTFINYPFFFLLC